MPEQVDKLSGDDPFQILHASCVAHRGHAVLIFGNSGSGKSGLALQLLGFGAVLVADDRTLVRATNGVLMAQSPTTIAGLIEARGVGILKADYAGPTPVTLAVDMDAQESDRLPKRRWYNLAGQRAPLLGAVHAPHFPAAILQFLARGRHDE